MICFRNNRLYFKQDQMSNLRKVSLRFLFSTFKGKNRQKTTPARKEQSTQYADRNRTHNAPNKHFEEKRFDAFSKFLPNYRSYEAIAEFLNNKVQRRWIVDEQQELLAQKNLLKCIPTLIKYFQEGKEDQNLVNTISQLFIFCEDMKIFRNELFQEACRVIQKKIDTGSLPALANIYGTLVNFWQQQLPVCQLVGQKTLQLFSQKQIEKEGEFLLLINFMQILALNKGLNKKEKDRQFQNLEKSFMKFATKATFQNPSYEQKVNLQSSILYDMMRTFQMDVGTRIGTHLKKAYDLVAINIGYKGKNANGDMADVRKMLKNTRYIKSRFQLIFEKKLKEMGFDFETNVMIKGNEYDFLIKGIKQKKNIPLSAIDILQPRKGLENQVPFSIALAHNIASSENVDFYSCDQKMEPVILEINGPFHHIDTDVPLQNGLVCREMFKFEKLPLYGVKRYNIVNFAVWEEKNKFPGLSEQYVSHLVNSPVQLPIPSIIKENK